jgi:predicted nucleotidyltransferase component of viral defense system
MGKDSILKKHQKLILTEIGQNKFIREHFYFTGGTALSEVYLKHRESVDLDFFSEESYDPQSIFAIFSKWSKKHGFRIKPEFIDPVHIYFLNFEKGEELKVDFAHYPHKSVAKKTSYLGLDVDSKMDIGVNKLLLISSQRTEVKDFVDLYFLLQELSLWDLIEGVRVKFNIKIDPFLLGSDFTVVTQFKFLPRMIKPLSLDDLKIFFLQEAKKLGEKKIE